MSDSKVRESRGWLRHHWPSALLVVLSGPIVFYGLGSYSLVNTDEEIYHVVAERMLRSGDFLTLWFYDEHRVYDTFMNAPIQYWARAAVIALLGSNEWSMRLLSALFAVVCVLCTQRLGTRIDGRWTGLLAGLLLLTTFQFVFLHGARTGELEPVVATLYVLAVLGFLRGLEEGGSFVFHHVCLALLLNVKTPTALIPLLGAGLCFLLLRHTRPSLARYCKTAVLVLPLGLVWHAWRLSVMWEPFLDAMGKMAGHAALRSEAPAVVGRIGNLFFYLQTLASGAFPQSLVFPLALVWAWRTRGRESRGSQWRVLVLYVAAVLIFYLAVARIHRWYIMPAYPLLAILVAGALSSLGRRPIDRGVLAGASGVAAGLVALHVSIADFNPFAEKAWLIPMEVGWQPWMGGWPLLATAAVGAAAFGGLVLLRAGAGNRTGPVLAALGAGALILYGSVRVIAPLRYVDHRSEVARLHDQLSVGSGPVPGEPVAPGIPIGWDARFYFANDWEIELQRGGRFVLHPRGKAPKGARTWATEPPAGTIDSTPSTDRPSEAVQGRR